MTVVALILLKKFYTAEISLKLKCATIGVLFVNISIGGTLAYFAAPPVLMVAPVWGWGTGHMLTEFGWKGALACFISTAIVRYRFRNELSSVKMEEKQISRPTPLWISLAHLVFLVLIVLTGHYIAPIFRCDGPDRG